MDVYVRLAPLPLPGAKGPKVMTEPIADAVAGDAQVFLDYDANGEICGIEILDATGITAEGHDIEVRP